MLYCKRVGTALAYCVWMCSAMIFLGFCSLLFAYCCCYSIYFLFIFFHFISKALSYWTIVHKYVQQWLNMFSQTFSLASHSTTEFFVFQQSFFWHDVSYTRRRPEFLGRNVVSKERLLEDEELCCWKTKYFLQHVSRQPKHQRKISSTRRSQTS